MALDRNGYGALTFEGVVGQIAGDGSAPVVTPVDGRDVAPESGPDRDVPVAEGEDGMPIVEIRGEVPILENRCAEIEVVGHPLGPPAAHHDPGLRLHPGVTGSAQEFQAAAQAGKAPNRPKDSLKLWLDVANRTLLETHRSERFLAAQAGLLREAA